LVNPYVVGGGVIYVIAALLWIYLLSKEELSRIYPLQSLCYVARALAGVFLFRECFTGGKALGLILIVAGAFLLAGR
jgi:drug/metabolite transporter (DMT)-like permease